MYFDAQYKYERLLDSEDSRDMTVNGSNASPVNFTYQIQLNRIWWLDKIDIFLLDEGSMGHSVFGSLDNALANGIRIRVKKAGIDYVVRDIKDNVDLMMAFNQNKLGGSSVDGFLNENDYYTGTMLFNPAIRLFGKDDDLVGISIRDDLRGITRLEAVARFWQPVT